MDDNTMFFIKSYAYVNVNDSIAILTRNEKQKTTFQTGKYNALKTEISF